MAWTAPKTWADGNTIPEGDLNTHIRDNLLFLRAFISPDASSELTIAAGVITVTQTYHSVDTAGDAATDDLDTIAGVSEGQIVILLAEHTDRTVVLKHGTGNLILGVDISLDDTNKHVALICDAGGDMHLLYTARDVTFTANAFQYPAPGTDWTPQLEGAHLAQNLGAKKCWLPLNFLKIGDSIVSYKLVGDAVEGDTLTLDCKLVRVNLADPLTTTDVAGGGIVQIDADGDFDILATLTALEVVATDKQYALEILGTTGAGDTLTIIGAEVLVRRLT